KGDRSHFFYGSPKVKHVIESFGIPHTEVDLILVNDMSAYLLMTETFELPNMYGLIGAGYIGIFEMGITFVLWLKAMHLTERTDKISQLVFLSPFLSLFFIHIFVGETIYTYTIAGLVLIVSGIVFQQYQRKAKK
ncbi:MAG: EamA family transporter, partial [Bacteroidales bacterium]